MKLKKSVLAGCFYFETLAEKNPTFVGNDSLRITLNESGLRWVISTSIYQASLSIGDYTRSAEGEAFDIGVNRAKFFATLKAADSDWIEITVGETIKIIGGSLVVTLPVVDTAEMPSVIDVDGSAVVEYPSGTLDGIGKLPLFTVDDNGPLSGISIRCENKTTTLFSTDRTVVYTITRTSGEAEKPKFEFVLPSEIALAIAKIGITATSKISLGSLSNGLAFILRWDNGDGTNGHITSRVIAGAMPNIDRVFDNAPKEKLVVNRLNLLEASKLYFTITEIGSLTIGVVADGLEIKSSQFNKKIPFSGSDNTATSKLPLAVSVDVKKLTSVLTQIPDEEVTVFVNEDKPYLVFKGSCDRVVLAKVRRF